MSVIPINTRQKGSLGLIQNVWGLKGLSRAKRGSLVLTKNGVGSKGLIRTHRGSFVLTKNGRAHRSSLGFTRNCHCSREDVGSNPWLVEKNLKY